MGNQLLGARRYPNSANHKGFNYLSQRLIQQAHDRSSLQFPTKYRVSSTSDGLIRNPDDPGPKKRGHATFLTDSSARGLERRAFKGFHSALGVADWRRRLTTTRNASAAGRTCSSLESMRSIRKVGHEEGGARRGHGSGDVVRSGDAIQQ